MTDLSDIEAKARAATAGPWEGPAIGKLTEHVVYREDAIYGVVAYAQTDADAVFIAAANPATVLRLCAVVRAARLLRDDLARVTAERDELAAMFQRTHGVHVSWVHGYERARAHASRWKRLAKGLRQWALLESGWRVSEAATIAAADALADRAASDVGALESRGLLHKPLAARLAAYRAARGSR